MATDVAAPDGGRAVRGSRGAWLGVLGAASRSRRGRIGLALVVPVVLVALVGPYIAPKSPTAFVGLPFAGPSSDAWLGTDGVGRDVLSRVLYGGREILALAVIATAIGIVVGTAFGVTAGYVRGLVDETIMRTLDVALAFPQIILALLLVSIVGPKLWIVCLAVAAIHAPQVARVARAATLRTVDQDYVKYAEAFGIPRRIVMVGEIVPNIISPVMVEAGLRLTYSIAIIASLSFLGFGLQPPNADWGVMVNENRIGIQQNPWPVVVPIVLIAVLTVGANMFSDAVARTALGIEAPIAPPAMLGSESDPTGGPNPAATETGRPAA
jgi:peptide/nickel transport system permease protein